MSPTLASGEGPEQAGGAGEGRVLHDLSPGVQAWPCMTSDRYEPLGASISLFIKCRGGGELGKIWPLLKGLEGVAG